MRPGLTKVGGHASNLTLSFFQDLLGACSSGQSDCIIPIPVLNGEVHTLTHENLHHIASAACSSEVEGIVPAAVLLGDGKPFEQQLPNHTLVALVRLELAQQHPTFKGSLPQLTLNAAQ